MTRSLLPTLCILTACGGANDDPSTPPTDAGTEPPTAPVSLVDVHDLAMHALSSGEFAMGSPPTETNRNSDETQHSVTLTRGFRISRTEVSQALWEDVMDSRPWLASADSTTETPCEGTPPAVGSALPARCISWDEAIEFCNRLSEAEGLEPVYRFPEGQDDPEWNTEADGYRLPTEAEWEYAARNDSELEAMLGGAAEWVWDWYVPFTPDPVVDPIGGMVSIFGRDRVFRSNSSVTESDTQNPTRIAARGHISHSLRANNLGLRIARNPIDP